MTFPGEWDPMGMRGTVSRDMVLQDVFVPDDGEVLPPGTVRRHVQRLPALSPLAFSATFLGLMQAAYDCAIAYLTGKIPAHRGCRPRPRPRATRWRDALHAGGGARAVLPRHLGGRVDSAAGGGAARAGRARHHAALSRHGDPGSHPGVRRPGHAQALPARALRARRARRRAHAPMDAGDRHPAGVEKRLRWGCGTTASCARLSTAGTSSAEPFLVAVWSWGLAFYGLGIYLVALGGDRPAGPCSAVSVAITGYYLMGAEHHRRRSATVMRRLGAHRVVGGRRHRDGGRRGRPRHPSIGCGSSTPRSPRWRSGWACMSGAAINILVAPWFIRQRGVAVSLALTGRQRRRHRRRRRRSWPWSPTADFGRGGADAAALRWS